MCLLVSILHEVSEVIKVCCPFLVAGVAIVILYWTSVTYGAITLLQVMGYNDGMRLLERTQPLALIVGLPSIPVALILGQFFKWEDSLSNSLLQLTGPDTSTTQIEDLSTLPLHNEPSPPISGSRILCSALLLPTVSAIIGRAFHSIDSNLLKTILGGLSFIAVNGTINIILRRSEYFRKRHKKILDFNESNLSEFANNRPNRSRSDSDTSMAGSNTSMEMLVIESLMPM
ncbi:E3 ubiquitin-protein ligase MARCHF5-like isoform X2 [Bradysia coprophila]|nr:E3 ubiquitin-protein ligase MARCHF5-like isoform X2 [Bradysia coprophila]